MSVAKERVIKRFAELARVSHSFGKISCWLLLAGA
jgi:hypothetical protein